MKRTPIISVGQVYLHADLNEYLVVTKSTRGLIQFKGTSFSGMNDVELFLERFGPVNPEDLLEEEATALKVLLPCGTDLLVGWVSQDGDEEFDE
jgi:hypothetical protein